MNAVQLMPISEKQTEIMAIFIQILNKTPCKIQDHAGGSATNIFQHCDDSAVAFQLLGGYDPIMNTPFSAFI